MSAVPHCYRHPDRETGLACSECGRPICTDCVTYAPVGLRCPDHSGKAQGKAKVAASVGLRGDDYVTRVLIAINVAIFLGEIATGATLQSSGGSTLANKWLIWGPDLKISGEWYRLVSSGFIHSGIWHIAMNMYSLYLLGGSLERLMGRGRYLVLYFGSLLAGSAGVLLVSYCSPSVGASGAIFGLLGAAIVLERQQVITAPNLMGVLVLNLVFTFSLSNYISVGGHLGGLVGGVLIALAYSRFGRGHALYGKLGVVGLGGAAAVIAGSVALSILLVHGHNLFDCVIR
jgi:membrane associated rhomboid family serine protease